MSYLITKASGKQEQFDADKVRRSLERVGAKPEITEYIIQEIQKRQPRTTHDIYQMVHAILKQSQRSSAVRYNLKRALLELGPEGFSFEKFIAELFKRQEYHIVTDQHVMGYCVMHEIDVIASKQGKNEIIECKFHNAQGIISDIKIPLYMKARFDDILKAAQKNLEVPHIHNAWVITNTRFSADAIQYAECVGIHLLSWSYPKDKSLSVLIDRYELYPITIVPDLSNYQKQQLIAAGVVLCEQIKSHVDTLHAIGMKKDEIDQLLYEIKDL